MLNPNIVADVTLFSVMLNRFVAGLSSVDLLGSSPMNIENNPKTGEELMPSPAAAPIPQSPTELAIHSAVNAAVNAKLGAIRKEFECEIKQLKKDIARLQGQISTQGT